MYNLQLTSEKRGIIKARHRRRFASGKEVVMNQIRFIYVVNWERKGRVMEYGTLRLLKARLKRMGVYFVGKGRKSMLGDITPYGVPISVEEITEAWLQSSRMDFGFSPETVVYDSDTVAVKSPKKG